MTFSQALAISQIFSWIPMPLNPNRQLPPKTEADRKRIAKAHAGRKANINRRRQERINK